VEKNKKTIHNPITGSEYEIRENAGRPRGQIKDIWKKEEEDIEDTDRIYPEIIEIEDFIDEMITLADTSMDIDDHRNYWRGYKKASQDIIDWIRDWNTPDDDFGQ